MRESSAALGVDSAPAAEPCTCLADTSRSVCLGGWRSQRVCERVCGDRCRWAVGEVGGEGEQRGDSGCWSRRWRGGEGGGGESIALRSEEAGLEQRRP